MYFIFMSFIKQYIFHKKPYLIDFLKRKPETNKALQGFLSVFLETGFIIAHLICPEPKENMPGDKLIKLRESF